MTLLAVTLPLILPVQPIAIPMIQASLRTLVVLFPGSFSNFVATEITARVRTIALSSKAGTAHVERVVADFAEDLVNTLDFTLLSRQVEINLWQAGRVGY